MDLLIVAANDETAQLLENRLQAAIPGVHCISAPPEAKQPGWIAGKGIDLILHDQLEGIDNWLELPHCPALVATGALEGAEPRMHAIRRGAFDYLAYAELSPELLSRVVYYAVENAGLALRLEESKGRNAYLASHDELTGLRNRARFVAELAEASERAVVNRNALALLLIHLDAFRAVNDALGQQAGDTVLKVTVQRIHHVLRGDDALYRIDGKQFAVLMAQADDDEQGVRMAAGRIHKAMSQPLNIYKQPVQVGASIGAAIWPADADSIDALISAADAAMRAARTAGGGFRMADATMAPAPRLGQAPDDALIRH